MYYNEALQIILNKERNSLTVNYYQLFVHHLGITHKIHLSSFISFVYYKVKDEMVHRIAITIYSEPVTSLNDLISAFMNCTSTLKLTRHLNAADYINHTIKLNGFMYAVVSPADPVPYDVGTTAPEYGLFMMVGRCLKFIYNTLLYYNSIIAMTFEETQSCSSSTCRIHMYYTCTYMYIPFLGDVKLEDASIVLLLLFLFLLTLTFNLLGKRKEDR